MQVAPSPVRQFIGLIALFLLNIADGMCVTSRRCLSVADGILLLTQSFFSSPTLLVLSEQ